MKARITINTNTDGELEIWLNESGRDLLVRELQLLDERHEHFHLMPEDHDGQLPLRNRPYRDGDQIVEWGKVLFRPDSWDKEYFPHVLDEVEEPD